MKTPTDANRFPQSRFQLLLCLLWIGWISRAHALPAGQVMYDATFGNGTFVAVGAKGIIHSSAAGESWAERTSGVTKDLRTVTFGGGTFVAAGEDGTLLSSPDGQQWTIHSIPAVLKNPDSAYGNGRFVVAGKGATGFWTVLVSTNGTEWQKSSVEAPGPPSAADGMPFAGLAFGSGEFRAEGGSNGGNLVLRSVDGIRWVEIAGGYGTVTGPIAAGHGGFASIVENQPYSFWFTPTSGGTPWGSGLAWAGRFPRALEAVDCGFLVSTAIPGVPHQTDISIVRSALTAQSVTNVAAAIYGIACGGGRCVGVGEEIVPLEVPAASPGVAIVGGDLTIYANPSGGQGLRVILSCVDSPYHIQWLHNGLEVRGATNEDFSVRALHESAGQYIARVTDSASQTYESPPMTLTVLDPDPGPPSPARIVSQNYRGPINLPLGSAQSLTVAASGSPFPAIQWQRNGVDLPGATNSALTLGYVTTETAGTFRAIARNELGEDTSAEIFITPSSLPPSVVAQSPTPSYVFSEGAPVSIYLPITAQGYPSPSVSLLRNGNPVDVPPVWAGYGYILQLGAIAFSDAGEYSLVLSNSVGVAAQPFANLKVVPAGPLDHWTRRNPLPQGWNLKGVAFGDGRFVGVGDNGAVVVSTNGLDWSTHPLTASVGLGGICHGNGRYVAVGGSTIMASEDGVRWRHVLSRLVPAPVSAVAFGNGRFVVTQGPAILTSTDGLEWVEAELPAFGDRWFTDVAYGNGRFVATSSSNPQLDPPLWTSTDGITWNPLAGAPQVYLSSVDFAGGLFIALGFDGLLLTSPNGTDWTRRSTDVTTRLLGAAYGNGRYVAVGVRGRILSSTDGVTWKKQDSDTGDRLESVTFGSGQFIAAGENGTLLSSPTGTQWTKRHRATTRDLDGMTVGDGLVAIVGKGGTILTSRDGVELNAQNSGTSDDLHGIAWADHQFVAVGEPGSIVTSPDAVQWTRRPVASISALKAVTRGAERWVAVGTQGEILHSDDGTGWSRAASPTTMDLNGVAFGKGLFVVVGDNLAPNGTLLTSPDGVTWTRRNQYIGKNLRSVAFIDGKFVATANDGRLIHSSDGLSWSEPMIPAVGYSGFNIRSITRGAGQWLTTMNSGVVVTSPELEKGNSWTLHQLPTTENLHAAVFHEGRFLVIGNRGSVFQSGPLGGPVTLSGKPVPTGFELRIEGDQGLTYRLESTEDLSAPQWRVVETLWLDGPVHKTVQSSTGLHRFYRVVLP